MTKQDELHEVTEIGTAGGEVCLDFTNTVSNRHSETPREHLLSYEDLVQWAERAGVIDATIASRLRTEAAAHEERATEVLQRALKLRTALYSIFASQIDGTTPPAAHMAFLNEMLASVLPRRRLVPGEENYAWRWRVGSGDLDFMLWPVILSATELLTSGELDRVHECEGDRCGWLFLDRSKNRSRRWCDMKECGNVVKVRRYRARHKHDEIGP